MILFAVSMFPMLMLSAGADCPVDLPCTCDFTHITCSSKGLNQVPIFRSSTSTYRKIILSRNNITRVENNAFSNIKFDDAMTFDLRFNNIEFIGDHAFSGFENATTTLYLDHNKLKNLPRALLLLNNISSLHISKITTLDSEVIKHIGSTLKFFDYDFMDATTGWFSEWFPEMKYLTALTSLTIYNGRFETFSGTLPNSLTHLSVFGSVIMGNFTLICSGNNLQVLDFVSNDFTKASMPVCQNPLPGVNNIGIASSVGLEHFPIETLVMNYPNVFTLSLGHNNISAQDFGLVSENNHVKSLQLINNILTEVPSGIQQFRAIRYLYLQYNKITALRNNDFANLTNLFVLRLGHNPISFVANDSLKSCTNLYDLSIVAARLRSVPHTLKYLTNLNSLDLTKNNISALNEGDFRNLIGLKNLVMSFNPITFVHRNTFDDCPDLQVLYLSSADLKSVPDAIISLSQLKDLDLSNNAISVLADDDFKYKAKLTSLTLDHNPLSSISRNAFKGVPNLSVLSLKHTLLTTVPHAVSDIPVNTKLLLDDAPVRCDCDLAWVPKEDVDISGDCKNSTTTIVDFIHTNTKTCSVGPVIG